MHTFLRLATFSALLSTLLTSAVAEKPRTVLDDQFCQVYYALDDGECEALRDSVRSEIRGEGTPTLELGDPSKKPVIVFFHGWPDTSALWANQFKRFCSEGGKYACVAPSMMDYNPDVEPADRSKLSWPLQADVLHEVVIDLALKDITLVIHDFGSVVGSQYVSRHPEVVKRVVNMDVGNHPVSPTGPPFVPSGAMLPFLTFYQRDAIAAFRAKNDTAMDDNIRSVATGPIVGAPCLDCKIAPNTTVGVGYRTGWMHYNFVNSDPAFTSFFDEPIEDFEFYLSPSWPDHVPQLFLWATEEYHQPGLLEWLDERGDGSGHARMGHDHWFMTRNNVTETNDAMAKFFDATAPVLSSGATALHNSMIVVTTGCMLMTANLFW